MSSSHSKNNIFYRKNPYYLLGLVLGLLCFSFFSSLLSQKYPYIGKKISRIEFYGLKNISADELYEVITSRYDESLTEAGLNTDLHKLFATGYFSNIIMRVKLLKDKTVLLSYEVREVPQVDEVRYIGLEALSVQDFIRRISIQEDGFFSLQKVKESAEAIKEVYIEQGLFQVEVWYRLSEVDKQRNTLNVYFIIDEGNDIPIAKINILGTRRLDPDAILNILEQQESGALTDSPFQGSKFKEDKFKILSYAKSQGLLDVQLDPEATGYEIRWRNPQKPEKGRVIVITYKILEGPVKYFGGYSLEHLPAAINQEANPPERVIKDESQLKPVYPAEILLGFASLSNDQIGEAFDESLYFRDRGSIQEAYARQGYVFAQIRPQIIDFTLNEKNLQRYKACFQLSKPKTASERDCKQKSKWLPLKALEQRLIENPDIEGRPLRHIHFQISENNLAYVENIVIRGNEKTNEYVIRRAILIKEGQLFNSTLVNLSRQKLINLQYFSEVNLQMRPGSDRNKMNIVFEVKEQPTGTISLGGTYGEASGFALNVTLGENNLEGTGQGISGTIEYGPLRRVLSVNWREPWFYEACDSTTGSFWKNKQKAFDEAESISELIVLSQTLQNEHAKLGKSILSYTKQFEGDRQITTLDRIKVQIRELLAGYVAKEEECFRRSPSPWSLGVGGFVTREFFTNRSSLTATGTAERGEYQEDSYGLTLGTSHALSHRWSHYHRYVPEWSSIIDPSALAPDIVFLRAKQGTQFQSSLRNGLIYSDIDNSFTPTKGQRHKQEVEFVGGLLSGDDHFNRYILSGSYYFWWFDFTFGGLFRSKELRLWRVVQEFTYNGTFTQQTQPVYKDQDNAVNSYIEISDRLFLGGPGGRRFGRLRGYSRRDPTYPSDWRSGAHHMLLFGTELRIPIEPRFLWLGAFFEAGSLYNTLEDLPEEQRLRLEDYSSRGPLECAMDVDPNANHHFDSCVEWNDPNRTALSLKNIAPDRFLYSWGYGLRIQIPVLPLRLYYAQKLYYAGKLNWKPIPGDSDYELVFGIGDYRF